ncbi:MAG: GGDEF domain-containing protein [Bauldia sp.]|nr:GGDEF domain-containing protein [Bauldia sp.]
MPQFLNAGLLLAEVGVYFAAMAVLFRLRHKLGIGIFFCALGVMHFLETYLASVLYVALPLGVVVSPGSTVLFAGKLLMLLLVFIREDAATARQPIYGLFIGNLLIIGLVLLLRLHNLEPIVPDQAPDFAFMDEMGWLMAWGTTLLFIDSILIIVLYQKSAEWFGDRQTLRIWLSAALVLSFDQTGFYLALRILFDMPVEVLIGGWMVKMATGTLFAALIGFYLHRIEPAGESAPRPNGIGETFGILTYRRRYHKLLAEYGHDALTGVYDRRRYDAISGDIHAEASATGQPLSLIVVDVDHFKAVNDAHGHAAGDRALKAVAQCMAAEVRRADAVFRYGGEEFVVLCPGTPHGAALLLAERLRRAVAACDIPEVGRLTISAGVATAPQDAPDMERLFLLADNRLYRAKAAGRNRVFGGALPRPAAGQEDAPRPAPPAAEAPQITSGAA